MTNAMRAISPFSSYAPWRKTSVAACGCLLTLSAFLVASCADDLVTQRPEGPASNVVESRRSPEATTLAQVAPGWELIDENPETVQVAADARGNIYQLHRNGAVFMRFNDRSWVQLDDNPRTRGLVAGEWKLVQIHDDGSLWLWDRFAAFGPPFEGKWRKISDEHPGLLRVAVDTFGDIYKAYRFGEGIFRLTGQWEWRQEDQNPATADIAAGFSLYQVHNDGVVWEHVYEAGVRRWVRRSDRSPALPPFIYGDGKELYRLEFGGRISKYIGPRTAVDGNGWQVLDDNSQTGSLNICDRRVFQLHQGGAIFVLQPDGDWQQLDDNPNTTAIVCAGANRLLQLHRTGAIYQLWL